MEPIELCFRERKGSLIFDRVLCSQHHEWPGKKMSRSIHGYLMLLHCLEQGRLSLGSSPIYFIRQDDLADDGSRAKFKLAFLLVVNGDPCDIARKHVRRELDTVKRAVQR